jgi:hypothetical protein
MYGVPVDGEVLLEQAAIPIAPAVMAFPPESFGGSVTFKVRATSLLAAVSVDT